MEAKTRKSAHRALALVLALMLCLTLLIGSAPSSGTAGSGDDATWTQVTSADEITSGGSFALVACTDEGSMALGTDISNKISGVSVTIAGNTLIGTGIPVWTVSASGTGVSLYNGSEYLGYNSGTNFRVESTAYAWNVVEEGEDTFRFTASGDTKRAIAWQENNNGDPTNRYGAYATSNAGGTDYVFDLLVFKSTSSSEPGTVAAPQASPQSGAVASGTEITLTCATTGASIYYTLDESDPSSTNGTLYSGSSKPKITKNCTLKAVAVLGDKCSAVQTQVYTVATVQNISDALAAESGTFTVKGVVTLVDGQNIYLQDSTGAICARVSGSSSGVSLGDTLIATGSRGEYNGLPQLNSATYTESTGLELTATTKTIGELTTSDICTYVQIANVTVTDVYDDNGQYQNPNITVKDANGKTIQLYKAILGDKEINVGDTLTIKAAVGVYNTTLQLRNTVADEITIISGGEPEAPTSATLLTDAPEEGDMVLIHYPAGNKVMSTESYTYNSSSGKSKDELVALNSMPDNGTISNIPDNTALFKVYKQDGHYVFKCDAGYLYLDGTHVRLVEDLGEYTYFDLESAANGWFIKSTNAQFSGKSQYLEFYGGYFTCYGMGSDTSIYTFQFYKAGNFNPAEEPLPGGGGDEMPISQGDEIGIYLPGGSVVITTTASGNRLSDASATLEDGILTTEADDAVFIVDGNNTDGFTFATADGKYLTTSTTGNTLSMADTASEYGLWILEQNGDDGWFIKSKNAAFNGNAQYIEYYNSSFTTYSKYNDSDEGIYTFQFYPVATGEDDPDDKPEGLEVRAAPVSGASVERGDTIELTTMEGAAIYYTTNGTEPTKASILYSGELTVGSAQVPEPTSGSPLVIKAIAVLPADVSAGTEEQIGEVFTFTYTAPVSLDGYQLYFGQLHSHTNISDGAGSVTEAFQHATQVDNLDFLAVTDHSNSFDNESDSRVDLGTDLSEVSDEWKQGHEAADAVTDDETFVGIYGFEMTWSDGFGHINTFNTPGFESRSNREFGNKSGGTEGYQNYYDKLVEVDSSLSQFNHPGTTFGDFQDFAFYDPQVDQRITLIEVGNGEGAIGSSGYFPSYEYYTRALDKGWHVAPTNNQDNHKGNWGDSNTARSVVLAYDLTEEAIYDAIANYRVYATEDNDLSILYSLNGNAMGSILPDQDSISISAQISDPTDSADMKVEVIVNGGLVAATKTLSGGNGTVEFSLSDDYSYYYLRVTQADGNIAVTAPVWTGESVNAGISKTECDTALVVKDEEVNISSELYNNSGSDMTVNSVVYSVDGEEIYTATGIDPIASGKTYTVTFPYTFKSAGKTTVNVTMTAAIGGTEYTFTSVLQLTVTDESLVTRVLIDGTHWNDYVTGYYSDRMGNFAQLAAGMNAQVTIKKPGETIKDDDLEDVALLVISAPLKHTGSSNTAEGAEPSTFSPEFINMVADYAKAGGTVILCGLADYQDSSSGAPYCSTEQINPILEAMGSTLRLNDDEVLDDDTEYNGGSTQTYRVYMDDFNTEEFPELFEGIQEGQRYSAYSGCSVDLGANGSAIVRGSANCYSINSNERPDNAKGQWDSGKPEGSTTSGSYDASTAVVQKGNVVTLATESVGSGRVYVAGTVFMSNFEISDAEGNDYGDASYANKTIITNILSGLLAEQEVSDIEDVRANTTVGTVFTVEGTITAGNVEPNAFYDTIYIQDATGGINIYPVATTDGTFRVGQKVRVTGSWDQYQGDTELRCISIELIDSSINPVEPAELGISDAGDYEENGGLLSKVSGTVKSVVKEGDAISSVILTDGTNDFRLLFNNYIGYSDESSADITTFVKEGAEISAVGVIYMDPEGVCLRIRDLSEVELVTEDKPEEPDDPDWPIQPGKPSKPSDEDKPEEPDEPFIDVDENDWFYDAVTYVYSEGMMDGVSDTQFAPNSNLTRGMVVTMLYRLEDEPRVTGSSGFDDVASGAWYADAVTWAAENGIVNGVSDTEFAPNVNITREQLAAILYRYAEYNDYDVSGRDDLSEFTDRSSISGYALDAMRWAVDEGLITGITDTTIEPQGTATRAQAATMFMRFMSTVR